MLSTKTLIRLDETTDCNCVCVPTVVEVRFYTELERYADVFNISVNKQEMCLPSGKYSRFTN